MRYLDHINSPSDLKKLSVNELPALADEVRGVLLQKSAKPAVISAPTWVWSKQRLPCTMFLIPPSIKLFSTFRISLILTKF